MEGEQDILRQMLHVLVWFVFSRNPEKIGVYLRPEQVRLAPPLQNSLKITSKNYFPWKHNPSLLQFADLGKSHDFAPTSDALHVKVGVGRRKKPNSPELPWPPQHC